MPQGIQVIRHFLISPPTLQTRAHNKYPSSDLFICFPNLPVATDEKAQSSHDKLF